MISYKLYNFCQGLRYEQTFQISLAWAERYLPKVLLFLKHGRSPTSTSFRPRQRNFKSLFISKSLAKIV